MDMVALCRSTSASSAITMHVGDPSGAHLSLEHDLQIDASLRADLLERLLGDLRRPPTMAWVTRSGPLAPGDADLSWCSAARQAFARHGWPLRAFCVVTPSGYFDLINDSVVRIPPTDAG